VAGQILRAAPQNHQNHQNHESASGLSCSAAFSANHTRGISSSSPSSSTTLSGARPATTIAYRAYCTVLHSTAQHWALHIIPGRLSSFSSPYNTYLPTEHFKKPMASSSGDMDEQFHKNTHAFLKWLDRIGVKLSPKAVVTDLRADGRGRALGKRPPFASIC